MRPGATYKKGGSPARWQTEDVAGRAIDCELIVLNEELEEGFLMLTHWALLWRFFAFVDMTAVSALPLDNGRPLEHLT